MNKGVKISLWTVGGLILALIAAAGIWFEYKVYDAAAKGVETYSYVRSGEELSDKTIQVLIDENIIEPGDTVKYFYSYGVFSILDGGSVLTDREVTIYEPDENGTTEVYLLDLKDVETVTNMVEGDILTDAEYRISGSDPDAWILIILSAERNKHLDFLQALRESAPNLKTEKREVRTPSSR